MLLQALNVVPRTGGGYGPFGSFAVVSAALAGRVRGAVSARDQDGTVHVYAGDVSSLSELQSDSSWLDKTRASGGAYACTETSNWAFAQFGDFAIATNLDDAMQVADMSAGTAFANLSGSPPRAKHICTFGDFVVTGYTDTSPLEVRWSGLNDHTAWTGGVNQSDAQIFPTGGFIQGFAPNDGYLLVFQAQKVRLGQYVGPPTIMDFSVVVEQEIGCLESRSICQNGRKSFFLSDGGFQLIDGTSPAAPIGEGKVNEFFFADVDRNYLYRMSAACDASRSLALWLYPSVSSSSGDPDTLLAYHWPSRRWALTRTDAELIFNALSLGYTLEDLDAIAPDLDAFTIPLDDPILMGGALRLGAFNRSSVYGAFVGPALAATIETGDFELYARTMGRAYVSGVRPVTDAAAVQVSIASRERAADTSVYGTAASLEDNGLACADSSGRYHRAKLEIAAAASWTFAQGLDFEAEPDGEN